MVMRRRIYSCLTRPTSVPSNTIGRRFCALCDSFRGGSFELSLGGNHSFKVPSYLRFIATVNFDHTTEELSPRFLDRSWVVTLDPQALDLDDLGDPLAPSTTRTRVSIRIRLFRRLSAQGNALLKC